MKKTEVIEKLKKGEIAIEMDNNSKKYINLLKNILKKSFPNDDDSPTGKSIFYFRADYDNQTWESEDYIGKNIYTIKITDITDNCRLDNFKRLEYYEINDVLNEIIFKKHELVKGKIEKTNINVKGFLIGTLKDGTYIIESESGCVLYCSCISKINPAIEYIKKLMKENNIAKEDL
jgi:hypothetical protein